MTVDTVTPEVGARVRVETPAGWVAATVTGLRASDLGEPFPHRVDVLTTDGRRFAGCHPACVRADA